jgi:pyruvate kinase
MGTATRILATLGPASWAVDTIREMILAGASAFRLNFSHGNHETLRRVVSDVRAVEAELGIPVALLGDLSGPKLRTGPLATLPIALEEGERVRLSATAAATAEGVIAVPHPAVIRGLEVGHRVLLDDGRLELMVCETGNDEVWADVLFGGMLSSNKGLNLPGTRIDIPAITEKDAGDLAFAIEQSLDWLALSFVQEARDVVDLKRRIALGGGNMPVIAKIERPLAVENLASILDVTDGIMVARGDLGVELGPEILPMMQKSIILEARRSSKLVITATEMLESMTRNPRPTRAEASDVANAILDGTDVVMLSQETAVGDHPVRVVETMRALAQRAESSELYARHIDTFQRPTSGGIAHAAIRAASVAAQEVSARAVAAFTATGWTALNLSCWRPTVPIYALTPHPDVCRRLALCWGMDPVLTSGSPTNLTELYEDGVDILLRTYRLMAGDVVVLLSGASLGGAGANTVKIHRVGDAL